MNRPRIAILSSQDTRSRAAWSGTPYYMAQALQRHCGDVVHLGPARSLVELAGKVRNRASTLLLGRPTPYHHAASLARDYARTFERRLSRIGPVDAIFAPAASTEIALLETRVPIIYTSDTTFALACDYHPGFSNLTEEYRAGGNAIELGALQRAAAITYPTEWAARSARETYGVDPARITVIPYGANLDVVPDATAARSPRRRDGCDILFLGVNWERKGGPVAFDAVRALRTRGMDATLTVCGCIPPVEYRADWVRVVPRLDKGDPAQQAALSRLLRDAHFLALPTRNDCYGIVFCEAAAHGTPSVGPDTGGVSGAIAEGRSGYLLPAGAGGDAYADVIEATLRDTERYDRLVRSSRQHYDEVVNWDAWGRRVASLVG